MKKIIILILSITLLCGCTKIDNNNIEQIINKIISSKSNNANEYKNGYKFYLPSNLMIDKINERNIVFRENDLKYYMFVDIVSYYHKVENSYKIKDNVYMSKLINYDNKSGYIEINVKNDKYLIEIMYNYAKIEVIVDSSNIANAITNSLIILSSVEYNDDIIGNLLEEDVLNYSEESFNIFETNSKDSNFLKVVEEYDNYKDDEVPDYDLIKGE